MRTALSRYEFGQQFSCVVKRDEKELELDGMFPEFVPEPYYNREMPTAQVDCTLSSEGKPKILFSSRNVLRARVWLTPEFADDEIEVVLGYKDKTKSESLPITKLTANELVTRYAENPEITTRDRYVDIEIE